MAEKLSVISLSYQMVEGLINNFKSNNWRGGQIHTHIMALTQTNTHTILAACARVRHECVSCTLLINSRCTEIKQKSSHCALSVFMHGTPPPRYGGCSPLLPLLSVKWRGGAADGLGAPGL